VKGDAQRVAVLGGGPAGLAAARELSAGGVDVVVLESAPWVGGLSMTTEHKGFRFDLGGHRWFSNREWLDEWFHELMHGELVTVNRVSRVYFNDRYIDYPIRILNVLRTAGVVTSALALLNHFWCQLRSQLRPKPIETIEQAFIAQFGSKLYQMFFKNYTEKVWGRDCSELSADWVVQRTKGLSIQEAVRSAIAKPRHGVESLVGRFVYPRLGYQRISERMQEDIEARGSRVLLCSTVIRVSAHPDHVVVCYRARDDSVHEIKVDRVVSTVPLVRLVGMLRPRSPSSVIDAAKGLEFRSLITANILLDKERVTRDTWLYIHDGGIGFARIHEPRNWSPAMAPPGKTSICAEWFCTVGDEIWQTSDAEIVERTVRHLEVDLGFIDRSEVIEGFASRASDAYPVYTLDYARRVETLKTYLSQYSDRISIAGRGGTFRYNNADHSIEMGLLVARSLLGEANDADAVNREMRYQEERIVGI
jgi:protoporphyrinogen oxidase